MKLKLQKILALVLSFLLMTSMLCTTAFAETDTKTVTNEDGTTTEIKTTTDAVQEPDGSTSVTVKIEKTTDDTANDGTQVYRKETETSNITTDAAGNVISSTSDKSGNEVTKKTSDTVDITVEIPLEENQTSSKTDPIPEPVITDNLGSNASGTDYDQTTTTVETPAGVTVVTNSNELNVELGEEIITHISSDTTPNADNDLIRDTTSNSCAVIPEEGKAPTPTEGYQYVYLGSGNSSQFWTAFLYAYEEGEDVPSGKKLAYTYKNEEGKTINLYRDSNKKSYVDELYIDNNKVELKDSLEINRRGMFQFVMYDPETGETRTTYCADLLTDAQKGYSYNIENVEDSDRFSEEDAAMLRTVATNGYWGNSEGQGSLDSVKELMRGATKDGKPVFTEDEIKSLTDGMALTATQYAVWTFSNSDKNLMFTNTMYSTGDDNFVLNSTFGKVPGEEESKRDTIFKLYDYLITLDPTTVTEEEKNTANTIINEQNFLKDVNITVIEKDKEHANNKDEDDTNDAYVTDLSFALVVVPSEDNKDDLVVKVLDSEGNEIASGRIAGEAQDGEIMLTPDDNGNYTFSGITLIEGDQNINLTLEGVQNLEEGVYLYTSEIKGNAESQAMLGMSTGTRDVSVSMNLNFNLSVEDEVIVTERVWHIEDNYSNDPGITPPGTTPPGTTPPGTTPPNDPPLVNIPPEDPPLVNIPDEEVPLANAPHTGDVSAIFMIMSALSGVGLAAVSFTARKKEEE